MIVIFREIHNVYIIHIIPYSSQRTISDTNLIISGVRQIVSMDGAAWYKTVGCGGDCG